LGRRMAVSDIPQSSRRLSTRPPEETSKALKEAGGTVTSMRCGTLSSVAELRLRQPSWGVGTAWPAYNGCRDCLSFACAHAHVLGTNGVVTPLVTTQWTEPSWSWRRPSNTSALRMRTRRVRFVLCLSWNTVMPRPPHTGDRTRHRAPRRRCARARSYIIKMTRGWAAAKVPFHARARTAAKVLLTHKVDWSRSFGRSLRARSSRRSRWLASSIDASRHPMAAFRRCGGKGWVKGQGNAGFMSW